MYFILIEMLTGQDVESLEEFERYHHNFNMYDEKKLSYYNSLTIIYILSVIFFKSYLKLKLERNSCQTNFQPFTSPQTYLDVSPIVQTTR